MARSLFVHRSAARCAMMMLGLVGCAAGVQKVPERDPLPPATVTLQVQAATDGGAGWRPVASGEVLRPGERFAVRIEVDAPLELRVGHRPAAGADSALLQGRASPGAPVLLPAAGGYYSLSGAPGEDRLYVVASRLPLSADELAAALRQLALDRDPPPGQRDPKSRDPAPDIVTARTDERGVAGLRFRLAHQ